jgi:L-alanine-DL-glutamate epimerase-like enolase superfamily enzyme
VGSDARLLDVPLCKLLGMVRDSVPIYGSGGFTSYSLSQVQDQLSGWVQERMRWVKMKVGRDPANDLERVAAVREVIGDKTELMVDANGAYDESRL